jgi:hypothetical protein
MIALSRGRRTHPGPAALISDTRRPVLSCTPRAAPESLVARRLQPAFAGSNLILEELKERECDA